MTNLIYLKKIFSSLMILAVIALSLDGIFFAFPKQAFSIGTPLTNVTNTPTSTQISASTSHKIDFTTYTTVPVDGKILITFPAGFNVALAAFSAWSGFDGNKTVSVNGQVVTITRTTGGTASAAGGKYITLSGITNTGTAGTNYTVTVETQNAAGTTLDGPTTSFYFSICTNACHTSTYQVPWTSTVSASGKHTTKFTTGSAIPADGKIKITFLAGFNITNASTTSSLWSDFDGGLSLAVNSQTITITRDGTGSSTAAGAKYITLENITNHSTAGSNYYAILETTNASDANIEGPTSIRFSVVSTGLGVSSSAAWPVPLQNNKRTNKTTNSIPAYPTIEWKNTTVTKLLNDGLIGNNNEIFAYKTVGNKQDLYALNADGTTKWIYNGIIEPATAMVLVAGAIDNEGTIYLSAGVDASANVDAMYAIDNSGQLKWFRRDNLNAAWSFFLDLNNDGSIFIKGLYTIYSGDGLKKSEISADLFWNWGSRTAIDSNNVIYAAQNSTKLYAINPDGTTKWTYTSDAGSFFSAPSIDSNGTIYIATTGAPARLRAINSSNGTKIWDVEISGGIFGLNAGAGNSVSIGQSRLVTRSDQNDITYVFDKTDGTLLATITESGTGVYRRGSATLDNNDNLLYFTDNKELTARDISGTLKWRVHGTETGIDAHAPIVGTNQRIYVTDATNGGVLAIKPWTLTASVNPSGYYKVGDTITYTATTTMLATDPVTSEANKIQVYDATGAAVLTTLAYSSTSGGNTIWTGTYQVPEGTTDGTYTATIEAGSVNVETDTTVHFASAPTNSNNKGITTTVNYVVDTTAPANFTPTANPSSWTTDTTPTITFSTTDATAGIDYYQVKIDSGSYATQTSPYTLPAQTDGTHMVTVKAVDRAGNSREASAITVYIDTTAPTSSTLSFGTITVNSIPVQVSGSTDANAGLQATPYYFQETVSTTNSGWQAGTTWTHSLLSANTQYTYQVKARDNVDTPNESALTTAQSKYTLTDTPTNLTLTAQSPT